jgi:CheY-specific phosphatase CheX
MLAGGLKSALCDKGYECAVSTPAIIRGTSFAIESLPDVRQEQMIYEINGSRFAVEVHVKFNGNN